MGLHLKAAICPGIAARGGEDYEKFCFVKWLVGCGPRPRGAATDFRRSDRRAFPAGSSISAEFRLWKLAPAAK
jgi:hypothetical protein